MTKIANEYDVGLQVVTEDFGNDDTLIRCLVDFREAISDAPATHEKFQHLFELILRKQPDEWSADDMSALHELLSYTNSQFQRVLDKVVDPPLREIEATNLTRSDMVVPLLPTRDFSVVLVFQVIASLEKGNTDEAVSLIYKGVRLAASLDNFTSVVNYQALCQVLYFMSYALRMVHYAHGVDPENLEEICFRVEELLAGHNLAKGVTLTSRYVCQNRPKIPGIGVVLRSRPRVSVHQFVWALESTFVGLPVLNLDTAALLKDSLRLQRILDPVEDTEILRFRRATGRRPYLFFVRDNHMYLYMRAVDHWMATRAHWNQTLIALQLDAYRAVQGRYPVDLSELEDVLGRDALTDPFSGSYYIFEPGEGDFRLYSIGADGRDNNGGRDDIVFSRRPIFRLPIDLNY